MKTIDQLTREEIDAVKVLAFDCDGVTVEEGTYLRERGNELTVKTAFLTDDIAKKLEMLKDNFFLVFTSGRSLLYLSRMYEKILWDKVALQAEGGIFTLYQGSVLQLNSFSSHFLEKSTKIKREIRELSQTNSNIIGFEPKQFLVTVHCQDQEPEILDIVKKNDPENEYHCLWSGEAYDIGPKNFNKGSALEFLLKKMGLTTENVLAIGNDPNDKQMVEKAKIGITSDPKSVISGADYVTNKKFHLGGEELIDKLLELTK